MTAESGKVERVRKVVSRIDAKEFEDVLVFLSKFLDSFGEFMIRTGQLERDHGEALKEIRELFSSPEVLQSFVTQAKPELLGDLVKVLFEYNTITSKLKKMETMEAEEKIQLGELFTRLSKDLEKLLTR